MKLSKRERNLLIGLGVVLLLLGYYRFILSPQLKNLDARKEEKIHYEDELIKIQTIIASEKEIDDKFTYINGEIDILSEKYFSEIDQSGFILSINELLEGTDLFVQNISFSPPRTESIGDALVEVMSITLPYEGTYSSLLSFLENIREYNPKTIIQNINIGIKEKELLSGTILLDFYSLPDLVRDTSAEYVFDSSEINPDPFYSFEEYYVIGDDYYEIVDLSGVKITLDNPRIPIEGFNNKILDFIPSHPSIKCEVTSNRNSKEGAGSLGLYYSFPPIEDEKQVHVILGGDAVIIKPPESIGLWVYSYDATKHNVGLRVKDRYGEEHDISLYSNIDWIGWRHLKGNILQDDSLYPMEIERITVEIDSTDAGKGTLLFDAMEAFYTIDAPVVIEDKSFGSHRLYDVQVGDTLSSISKAFYNDTLHQDIIKRYNGINSNSDLKPGRTIIIPDARSEDGSG